MFESNEVKALPRKFTDLESTVKNNKALAEQSDGQIRDDLSKARRDFDTFKRTSEQEKQERAQQFNESLRNAETRLRQNAETYSKDLAKQVETAKSEFGEQYQSLEARFRTVVDHVNTINSVMGVTQINKPSITNAKTVLSFLKETDDKVYNAFRDRAMIVAAALGKEGVIEQIDSNKRYDGYIVYYTDSHGLQADRHNATTNGVSVDVDGVRITIVSHLYGFKYDAKEVSVADVVAKEKPLQSVYPTKEPGKTTITRVGVFMSKVIKHDEHANYAGGCATTDSTNTPTISVIHRKNDSLGQRLLGEIPNLWNAVAYGAFQAQLEKGNMEQATDIFVKNLKDIQSGPLYDDLMSTIEANPTVVRYLQPVIEALESKVNE